MSSSSFSHLRITLTVSALIALSLGAVACKKPGPPPDPSVFAADSGKGSDALGREIHTALQQQDEKALLKLTAPPTLVKCDRKSAVDFMKAWKEKHKGSIQTVGAISDIDKVASGGTQKFTKCVAQKDVTFGQILVYSDPGTTDKQTPFTPFWIVKEGSDPSPTAGWYLADPF